MTIRSTLRVLRPPPHVAAQLHKTARCLQATSLLQVTHLSWP